jgi:para-aminobenzoate synthetase component 1
VERRVGSDGALAHFGGLLATGLAEVSDDLRSLDGTGRWAVVVTFEGDVTCARFDHWRAAPLPAAPPWAGPPRAGWTTSMDREGYVGAVKAVRDLIADGDVYQVNLCRVLSAPLPRAALAHGLLPLANRLAGRHEAPYAGLIDIPGLHVVSVDLVRNDLSRVCRPGSVAVPKLLEVQRHPGLVHLVSTVTGRLVAGAGWPELLAATFPPGSVSGAPKSTALQAIQALEPAPRGPYCGAVGWVDADTGEGELAVGIRTFWADGATLRFGTGAGITWGSDAGREWAETELKAERLVGLASC